MVLQMINKLISVLEAVDSALLYLLDFGRKIEAKKEEFTRIKSDK